MDKYLTQADSSVCSLEKKDPTFKMLQVYIVNLHICKLFLTYK